MSYNPLRVLLRVITTEGTEYIEKEIPDRSYIPSEVEQLYKKNDVVEVALYSFEYSKINTIKLKEAELIYRVLKNTYNRYFPMPTNTSDILLFAKNHKKKAARILSSLVQYISEVSEDKYIGDESLQSMFNYIKQHNDRLNIKL